jgi:hypothetical protein
MKTDIACEEVHMNEQGEKGKGSMSLFSPPAYWDCSTTADKRLRIFSFDDTSLSFPRGPYSGRYMQLSSRLRHVPAFCCSP